MALRIRSAAKILAADGLVHGVQWVVLCIEQRALLFLSIVEGNARLVVRTRSAFHRSTRLANLLAATPSTCLHLREICAVD